MFCDSTKIKILKEIDTADQWWCSSAVMFSVKNGKNIIGERSSKQNEDYEYFSQMELNGKPLVQGKYPVCSTCKGMLATGYGIENIDCPELVAVRECMNSKFISIMDSAEKIKPLLGLLSDGYYALADTICFPSDGNGHFFYEISNELMFYDAACYGYYCSQDLSCVEHFPLFLYPTQSASMINSERVDYYAELMRSDKNPPRALAYHLYGFMNALLDGHHKACAAASVGKYVRCLTIIPCDGSQLELETADRKVRYSQSNPKIKTLVFAGLKTDVDGLHYLNVYKKETVSLTVPYQKYPLTNIRVRYGPDTYPTVRDIAALLCANNKVKGVLPSFDTDIISGMISRDTDDMDRYLEAILHFVAYVDQKKAYKISSTIVKKGDGYMRHRRVRAALKFLLNYRDDETEQLFTDFYLDHKENDEIMDIVNSYWKNNKI